MDKIQGLPQMKGVMENPLLRKVKEHNTGVSFSERLEAAVKDVDQLQNAADTKLEMLASGKEVDIHGTMIALKEAELSMRLMGSFRDKVSEAYRTLINMTI
jgi:flagellar hook-basal body complex protein FliE